MIDALAHGDPGLYVLLLVASLLVTVLGLVMRSIVKGDLVPRSTVEQMIAERDARIAAQGGALVALTETNGALVQTNSTQADSIHDLAAASHLSNKVGQALRSQLLEEA